MLVACLYYCYHYVLITLKLLTIPGVPSPVAEQRHEWTTPAETVFSLCHRLAPSLLAHIKVSEQFFVILMIPIKIVLYILCHSYVHLKSKNR